MPGYYDKVTRAARDPRARARTSEGEPFELDADGMLAVCIQHEMDHLIGKVFVDHLSPLKRARLAARLRKKQRWRLSRRSVPMRVGFAGTPAFAATALARDPATRVSRFRWS